MRTMKFLSKLFLVILVASFSQIANAQETIFEETFDSFGGNSTNGTAISDFSQAEFDVAGWTGNNKCFPAGGFLKLGSSSNLGSITTPAIDLSDANAEYTLTFDACAWSKDQTSINVILDGNAPIVVEGLNNGGGDYVANLQNFSVTLTGGTSASKITFQGIQESKSRFFIDNVVVTKKGGTGVVTKEDPTCSFSAETATAILGETFTAPTFSTNSDGVVTYTSTETAVATVDENTGAVTLVGAGETTITASVSATDTYYEGSASYTLTVVDKNAPTFVRINSTYDFNEGVRYVIVNETYNAAMSSFGNDIFEMTSIDIINNQFSSSVNSVGFPYTVSIYGNETDGYTLKTSDNKFIEFHGSSNKVYVSETEVDGSKWDITFNDEANDNCIITNKTTTERVLQYNSNSGQERFACYKGTQNNVAIYAEAVSATISNAEYATLYSNKNLMVPKNVEAGIVTGTTNNTLIIDWKYQAGAIIPAGTGVILKGAEGTYTFFVSETEDVSPIENLLKGTIEEEMTAGENCLFYKLSYDNDGENLGFYWAEADGAAFMNGANKAYLAIPVSTAQGTKGFVIDNDGTTGIEAIENGTTLVDVYSINGILVRQQVEAGKALNGLQKGIYIVNGKKEIVK